MPARIRPSPLAAGLSVSDLPILPFLAPRLLQPWPIPIRTRRRKNSKAWSRENGVESVDRANGVTKSSKTRLRGDGDGGEQCSRERARATTARQGGWKARNGHVAGEGRKMYSTDATETRQKDEEAAKYGLFKPLLPLSAETTVYHESTDTTPASERKPPPLTPEKRRMLLHEKELLRTEKERLRLEATMAAADLPWDPINGETMENHHSPTPFSLQQGNHWVSENQKDKVMRVEDSRDRHATISRPPSDPQMKPKSWTQILQKYRKLDVMLAELLWHPNLASNPVTKELQTAMATELAKLAKHKLWEVKWKIIREGLQYKTPRVQYIIEWLKGPLREGHPKDAKLSEQLEAYLAEIHLQAKAAHLKYLLKSSKAPSKTEGQNEHERTTQLSMGQEFKELEKELEIAQRRERDLVDKFTRMNQEMLDQTIQEWQLEGLPIRRLRSWRAEEFPRFLKAWKFMNEAGKYMNRTGAHWDKNGDKMITQTFHHEWVHWFERFNDELRAHKTRWSKDHEKMEIEVNSLVNFDPKLEIEQIRKVWLKFLRWVEKDGSYERLQKTKESMRRYTNPSNGEAPQYLPEKTAHVARRFHERRVLAETRWPEIMLNVLAERPEHGLKFLLATCGVGPLSHDHFYSDVIDYLVNYHIGRNAIIARNDFNEFFDSIMTLLTKFSNAQVAISDFAVMKLFMNTSITQAEALYAALLAREKRMGINTRHRVAARIGEIGASDVAVHILETLYKDGWTFHAGNIISVCAIVLRGSQRDPNQKLRESDIFEKLLHFGLKPSIAFYNILAQNAVESGDHETAWKIYDMILENGMEPSPHTFSILINDAKWRVDAEALDRLTWEQHSLGIRNEFVANDMIHATWLIHEHMRRHLRRQDPREIFERRRKNWTRRTLKTYMHYFHLGPLLDLAPEIFGTFPEHLRTEDMEGDTGMKMHPDIKTLNLMVTSAVQCSVETDNVFPLYQRYKSLIVAGHPDFVRLARSGTRLEEAFIARLGQDPRTLPLCMNIMVDMLSAQESVPDDEAKTLAAVNNRLAWFKRADLTRRDTKKAAFAAPGVRTWTVLMQAFLQQKQVRAAEKVMDMMKARGIKPDKITWEHLVAGHFKAQDEEGTVNAIARAEEEGHDMEGTLEQRGLADREREMGIMERVVRRLPREVKPRVPAGPVDWKSVKPAGQEEGGEGEMTGVEATEEEKRLLEEYEEGLKVRDEEERDGGEGHERENRLYEQ